ncbi:MAG: ATP-binding protein [Candidatus Hodarchaeota archaeon]
MTDDSWENQNPFGKPLNKLVEEDLKKMESDPLNFESLLIEYKLMYNGDPSELRKDILQFANGTETGYLVYGVLDDPIQVVGIEKSEVDPLKTTLNEVLQNRIDPNLNPFPSYYVVPLSNGKYVFIIEIHPKPRGIYGLRQNDNSSNRGYYRYEFLKRMDGSKHLMNIQEVVELIEKKALDSKD